MKITITPELQAQIDAAKVKRLRPGKAFGADDLTNWASRRTVGRAGVHDRKQIKKQKKRAKKLSKISGHRVKPFGD